MGNEEPQLARSQVCHLGSEDLEPVAGWGEELDELANYGGSRVSNCEPLVSLHHEGQGGIELTVI
jgi:hypothetical protein